MRVYWNNLTAAQRASLGVTSETTPVEIHLNQGRSLQMFEAMQADGIVFTHAVEDDEDVAEPTSLSALILVQQDRQTLQAVLTGEHATSLLTALACFITTDTMTDASEDDASGDGAGDIHLAEVVLGQGAV